MVKFLIFLLLHCFHSLTVYSIDGFDFSKLGEGADFKVVVKHVGQGSCTIIENQYNGRLAIIDAGSSTSTPFNLDDEIVKELGGACVRRSLPAMDGDITLVVSHSDQDHINVLHSVYTKNSRFFAHFPKVILGDHFANYYKSSDSKALLRRIVGNLQNPPDQVVALSHNIAVTDDFFRAEDDSMITSDPYQVEYLGYREHVSIPGFLSSYQEENGLVFEILSVNAGAGTKDIRDENTNSAVVRLGINKRNILIMGDATGVTTQRILLNPENKKMLKGLSLLISSHHGGRLDETNNGLWLGFTSPERVAISAGYHGGYRHPNAEFLMDLIIVDSLVHDIPHDIALSGSEESSEYYVKSLASHMEFKKFSEIQNKEKTKTYKWLIFMTDLAVHSTGSSGSLYYVYNIKGELVSFWKEN